MSQSSGKGLKCRVGISPIHAGHQPVSALSLDQSANCALISCSLDQIPLPVTWHLPIFHFSWPVMDTRHIGNLTSTLISTASRASALFPLAERFNQLLAQFTFWKRIECNIDRLMRDLFGEMIRIHPLQSASNLFWRPPNSDPGLDYLPENRPWSKLSSTNRSLFSRIGSSTGYPHMIIGWVRKSLDLPADGGGGATKKRGYLADTALPFQFSHDDRSFLNREMVVLFSHSNILYDWCCSTWN